MNLKMDHDNICSSFGYLVFLNINFENVTSNAKPISLSDIQSVQNISHKLKVVSSFFPIGEFVKKTGGNLIESSLLIPNGIEPHDFEPTINQIQRVNSANVLFYNGLGIESWIDKISIPLKIQAAAGLNVSYYDNSNKTVDPHVWLDPELAKKEVENIRDGLIAIDPITGTNISATQRISQTSLIVLIEP